MKVLLTGAGGQVGLAVQRLAKARGIDIVGWDRRALDITDEDAVAKVFEHYAPTHVVNAAAYTAVDQAESEPERAYAVNRDGAAIIARAAQRNNCRIIHLSTDYVFDGKKASPYLPDDTPNPLNVYGASKLAGERIVLEATKGQALVVRTSWVYSLDGRNFLTTMLRLLRERSVIRVVDDQIGTPTSTNSVASALISELDSETTGIHHWTDGGQTTWFGFATAIARLVGSDTPVEPITTVEYPVAARRPAYSVLKLGPNRRPTLWRDELRALVGNTTCDRV